MTPAASYHLVAIRIGRDGVTRAELGVFSADNAMRMIELLEARGHSVQVAPFGVQPAPSTSRV
jgi:hypothetical protein